MDFFHVYEASKDLKIGILCVPDCAWLVACHRILSKNWDFNLKTQFKPLLWKKETVSLCSNFILKAKPSLWL